MIRRSWKPIVRQMGMIVLVALAVAAATPAAQAVSCSGPPNPQNPFLSGGNVKSPAITVNCTSGVQWIRVTGNLKLNGVTKATGDVTCPTGGPLTATSCTMPSLSSPGTSLTGWTFSWSFNWCQTLPC